MSYEVKIQINDIPKITNSTTKCNYVNLQIILLPNAVILSVFFGLAYRLLSIFQIQFCIKLTDI